MDITKLNIDFYNLQSELRKFPSSGKPVLDTVLEAIVALIQDLYNHYSPAILNAPVADYSALCGSMYAVANLLCDLHEAHQAKIQELGDDDLPEQFQSFRQELLNSHSRIQSQEDQFQALTAAKAELEAELDREKRNLARLQAEQARINTLNGTLRQTISQINAIDLPALQEQLDTLKAENSALDARLSQMKVSKTQSENTIRQLLGECNTQEQECTRLTGLQTQTRQKLAAAEALRQQLEQELTQLNDTLTAEDQKSTSLSGSISAVRDQLQQRTAHTAQLDSELAQLLTEESTAAEKEAALSAEVKNALSRQEVLNQTISDYGKTLEELANIEADITEKEAALASMNQEFRQQLDRKKTIQESISQVQKFVDSAREEADKLELQLREAEANHTRQQNTRDGLISTLTQTQTRTKALEAQALDLKNQISDTNTKTESLQEQVLQLSDQIKEAKQTHKDLLTQVYTLEQELAYQTGRNNAYRLDPLQITSDQLDQARQEYSDLSQHHQSLIATRDHLIQKRDQLDTECANIEVLTKILQSKLDDAQQELNRKNLAHGSRERELAEVNNKISIRVDGMKDLLEQIEAAKSLLESLDPVATKAKYTRTKADLDHEIAAVEQMKDDLSRAENELSVSRAEYNRLRDKRDSARGEFQSLESQLRILRDPATAEETLRLRNRICVMNRICDQLRDASEKLGLSVHGQFDPRVTVQSQLEFARSSLNDLSSSIGDYQKALTDYIPAKL